MVLRTVVFFVVFFGLIGGVHLFLYRRLVRDTTVRQGLRRVGLAALIALAFCLISARFAGRWLPPLLAEGYALVAWLWFGLATYLFLALVVFGAARWSKGKLLGTSKVPVDEERRRFLARTAAGSALVVAGGSVGYGYWRAYEPATVTELALRLPSLPRALDGMTVVHLSDIHVGNLIERKFMEDLVQRVRGLKPDLVAITGDLVDGDVDTLGPAVETLRKIQARFGTFFITGNHEYYSGADAWSAALTGMGVQVLRNRRVEIGDAGGLIDVIGVDDWSQRGDGGYDLEKAIAGRDPSRASILLAHQPQPKEFEAAVQKGIGLQLSGHTHGGQFFPGTALIPMIWKHPAGHYTHQGGHLYVSRGTGFWGPPLRVGSSPEIVKLTLTG